MSGVMPLITRGGDPTSGNMLALRLPLKVESVSAQASNVRLASSPSRFFRVPVRLKGL